MNSDIHQILLAGHDPLPARVVNPEGGSSFLLLGDHAGNSVPSALGTLGLSDTERARHIGWDIGIATLGPILAEALDAVFIRQTYSRLVIDCNRDPAAHDAMPVTSDGTPIPGNVDLSDADRAARVAAIHTPYQAAIAAEIERRDAAGMATILVSLHSFTPVMKEFARPWEIGVLYHGADTGFAVSLLEALRQRPGLTVGDNEPYSMDSIDYTIPRHAYPGRRPYAEIEVRQDLLGTDAGCAEWAVVLEDVLRVATGTS